MDSHGSHSGGPDLDEVAERALAMVDEGLEAQVIVRAGRHSLTRFAGSFIHQNVSERVSAVSLRVCIDGASATVSGDQFDDDALRALVRRATDAARLRPADPGWAGLSGPAPVPTTSSYDEATAGASPEQRAGLVRDFVEACGGLEAAGYCSSSGVESHYANSAGQRASGRTTSATVDGVARTGRSDGSGRATSVHIGDLDGSRLGERAAAKARDGADAQDLPPGRYEVVLEPACVADMLFFLDVYGFNGRAINEERSFVRLGEQQLDEKIHLWDDATDPRLPGLPYDYEGTPKRRVDLVVAGVTTSAVHDRRTAAAARARGNGQGAEIASTGHAIEGGDSVGAIATNMFLGAEEGPAETAADDLVGQVERGLLVTDFWYTRVLDPRTTVVTGLTRNGVFLIEDGKITRPVTNLRFTQSYVEALAPGNVLAVGSDMAAVDSEWLLTCVPSLRLGSWNFTGGAKG